MYIELDHISFGYEPGVPTLSDLSLSIKRGEAVALMGANGCGKTTVLNILSGILSPTAGTFTFDGTAITRDFLQHADRVKRFHQRVGSVFQNSDAQLFCPTVYEEIAFGPQQMGLSDAAVDQRVKDVAQLLDITALLEAVPYHLSGGQKKRIAIGATLAMNPEVLLMDEPMAALDPRTQTFLFGIWQELRSAGKTLIIATHDLRMVTDMVDRIILFDEAHRIVADGTPITILQQADLLKAVNLVDERYHVHVHQHDGEERIHIHW